MVTKLLRCIASKMLTGIAQTVQLRCKFWHGEEMPTELKIGFYTNDIAS